MTDNTREKKMAGIGSMGYGNDMQNYTRMKIWFTLLALVTIAKIGSLLKLQGMYIFYPIIVKNR